MRNMGGLWAKMPITFYAYLAATFALAGLFPFAGFWSKDEILLDAFNEMVSGHNFFLQLGGFIVLILLLVAAFFTAFYMWRQIQMVFFGKARSEAAANAPESAPSMAWVLGILGVASFIGGFINVPYGAPFSPIFKEYEFKHWLEPSIPSVTQSEALMFNWLLAIIATLVAGGAIYLAHLIYAGNQAVAESDEDELGTDPLTTIDPQISRAWHFANARMYWDETYYRFIEGPYNRTGRFLAEVLDWKFWHDYFHDSVIKRGFDTIANFLKTPFDIGLIDGIVNGVGWLIRQISDEMRGVQTGYVRTYAVAVLLGVVAVVVMMLLPLLLNAS